MRLFRQAVSRTSDRARVAALERVARSAQRIVDVGRTEHETLLRLRQKRRVFNSAQARENQERYCTDKRSAHRVAFGAQHESALHSAARDHTEVAVRVLKICTQRPQPVCSKRVSTCGDDRATEAAPMSETLAFGPCNSAKRATVWLPNSWQADAVGEEPRAHWLQGWQSCGASNNDVRARAQTPDVRQRTAQHIRVLTLNK